MCCRLSVIQQKYISLIVLVAAFAIAELVVGVIGNSITLITDSFHMLSDLLALIIGFVAIILVNRRHHRYTYGWVRAEIIAGLINAVFLLAIGIMTTLKSVEKFIELAEETTNPRLVANINLVLIVAGAGLVVNIIGIALFANERTHSHGHSHGHSHSHSDDALSEEEIVHNYAQAAVFLHIIGDTLGSIIVIASSLTIKYVEASWKFYLDPVGSLVIVIFIVVSCVKLLRDCIRILMHRWAGTAVKNITAKILAVPGVLDIHDFHVWPLDNKITIASMHVNLDPSVTLKDIDKTLVNIKKVLHGEGIHSSTIQPEWTDDCTEPNCVNDCLDRQCCNDSNSVELL